MCPAESSCTGFRPGFGNEHAVDQMLPDYRAIGRDGFFSFRRPPRSHGAPLDGVDAPFAPPERAVPAGDDVGQIECLTRGDSEISRTNFGRGASAAKRFTTMTVGPFLPVSLFSTRADSLTPSVTSPLRFSRRRPMRTAPPCLERRAIASRLACRLLPRTPSQDPLRGLWACGR